MFNRFRILHGRLMVAALPIIVGSQLLLAFLNYDVQAVPRSTLHLRLKNSVQPMRPLRQWDGDAAGTLGKAPRLDE